MRLLLIPDPTSPHGEDAFCREIARRAPKRGHQATVQAVPNGPLDATLDMLQATGFALGADTVLINSLQPAALLASAAAGRRTAVRLIDSYASASSLALIEVERLAAKADLLLVPSQHLARIAGAWGPNGAVRLVPYAYDRIRAQQIAVVTMRGQRHKGFQMVASAALNAATRPGFETLLAAVARLRLDCHLNVVGEGPALPALKERTQQLVAAERVSFLGSLSHEKLMEFFRSAKAYLDPCGLEGFPTLALHALSEGCPVIAARSGAVPEIIEHGVNGLLFRPGDPHSLSETVMTLASERGLSLKLIAEGINTVKRHNWDATVEAVFDALEAQA